MTLDDFKKEVLPLTDKIFRFAKRFLRSVSDAEDATQDTFLKLWMKKEELSAYRSVEAFAMTMTRNICLDRLRAQQRKPAVAVKEEDQTDAQDPYRHAAAQDGLQWMDQLITALPEQQRTIIQLREIEGYDFEEIAEVTGLTVNTIRVNLSRARKKIRAEITKINQYGLQRN